MNTVTVPRTVRFTDKDWQTLETIAAANKLTVSGLIHKVLGGAVRKNGYQWDGLNPRGNQKAKS